MRWGSEAVVGKLVRRKSQTQESISILSIGLIEKALVLLQHEAFPVYQRNIDRRDPPFAIKEFTPSAIAVLLMCSGLDYHLARLKYLRDIVLYKPPLPHTPYFNWDIDDSLSMKLGRLLVSRNERHLKEQLLELTVVRDSVAHPKVYLIREMMRPDLSFSKPKAKLSPGSGFRPKALQRKLKRAERTRLLRLPLVPTWISYPDAVVCVLVLTRFLNLLEAKYGNPYAWVGGFLVKNAPDGFFKDWGDRTWRSISPEEWAKSFFDSLSPDDQLKIKTRLGQNLSLYIEKRLPRPRIGKGTMADIIRAMQTPAKPEFLQKPPPWRIKV